METFTCSGQAAAGASSDGGEAGAETASGGAAGSVGGASGGASGRGGATGSGGGGRSAAGGTDAGVGGDDGPQAGAGGSGASGKAGAGGSGVTGGSAGASDGSGGAPNDCVDSTCCLNDEPQTSGPCGTGCLCLGDGRAHETRCYDGLDNDGDGDDDCADDDCANLACTAGPVELDVPIARDLYVSASAPNSGFDGDFINVGLDVDSTHRIAFFGVDPLVSGGIQLGSAELRLTFCRSSATSRRR